MSRSNYDKPFYVDVGTSIVAVRCASNHDVIFQYDHCRAPKSIQLAKDACDRMNKEAENGKPLRKCDLNLSAKSLWDKFEDYMHDCGLPFYSEPSGEDAFDWLLSPATEKGEQS